MSVPHMPFSNIIATSTDIVLHLIGSLFASWEKVHQLLPFLDVLAHLIFIKTPPTFYIDFSMSMPFGVYDPTIHKTQKMIVLHVASISSSGKSHFWFIRCLMGHL